MRREKQFLRGLVTGASVFICIMAGALGNAHESQAANCGPLTVNAGASINGFLNDQYVWYDSHCQERSAALALNDATKGGNAKQFIYTPFIGGAPSAGGALTVNPGDPAAGGFGYIVAHLANPSFANAYGADDSPLGSGSGAAYDTPFAGNNHAIHEYKLNYVRYGMTASATTAYLNYLANGGTKPFVPWDWLNACPGDPNCQYVTVYNMPVTIHWMFATGRDYPVWSVTFDLSQAPDYAVESDFRAPYGDMKVEGGDGSEPVGGVGSEPVGGVGWGDEYEFVSSAAPFTMNSAWDYSILNQGAPYDYLWTSATQAEMGLAGTQILANQNAGGYNNQGSSSGTYNNGETGNNLRGNTSTLMGPCNNDAAVGAPYTHTMPCMSDWAYQLVQYSLSSAAATTNDKRLAWGADWGSLGYGSLKTINGNTVSGWPKVSYSVYVVLDNHANNPTKTMAEQAKTISMTTLTASVGSVLTSGPAGVGRSDLVTYSPAGYSPIYSTWEVAASGNQAALTFGVASAAPSTLNIPVIVIHNYTKAGAPTAINFDGATLTVNKDYFVSLRPDQSELWITLNEKFKGTHTVQILNPSTADGLVVNFGASAPGLWLNQSGTWRELTPLTPSLMAAYGNDMVGLFPGAGLYQYDGFTWLQLTPISSIDRIVGTPDRVYVDFTGAGLWQYNGAWTLITTLNPNHMIAFGGKLLANFPGAGLYQYDGASWTQLTPLSSADNIVAGPSWVYAHFPSAGIYAYNGSTWMGLTSLNPTMMLTYSDVLIANFAGYGIYSWGGASWTQLTSLAPQSLIVVWPNFYANFANYGLFEYTGGWTKITPLSPNLMGSLGSSLIANFAGAGLYAYNGSAWSKLTSISSATNTIEVIWP